MKYFGDEGIRCECRIEESVIRCFSVHVGNQIMMK
jgi:hypothetical protein